MWVLDVHLTNLSRTLPVGIRNMKLEIIRNNETHLTPHLGNSMQGSHGEVPFPDAALPLAVRLKPVETISGKLRFFEWAGFTSGRVSLKLVFEANGKVHRDKASNFFDIPYV